MKKGILVKALAGVLGGAATAASGADIAVGTRLSTLGAGLEVGTALSERFNARLGFNYFSLGTTATVSDINYDLDLKLRSLSALLDWHPLAGGFHLSAGLIGNGNTLDLSTSGERNYPISDTTYTGDLNLDGNVVFPKAAPYLGIGWGNAFGKDRAWSFSAELGVMFQGRPQSTLTVTGEVDNPADPTQRIDIQEIPGFVDDRVREEQNLQDRLNRFRYYPVVAIGLMYRF